VTPLVSSKETGRPEPLQDVGITESLGAQLPLDTVFVNESGESVALSQIINGKTPVIFSIVYYSCPLLCNLFLDGVVDAVNSLNMKLGERYHIVSLSMDKNDTPATARAFKDKYMAKLHFSEGQRYWNFLVGKESDIQKVADTAGFHFRYDPDTKEYAHGAVLFILTPEGKLSRYLYGIQYNPKDLKLALLEASDGKWVSSVERALLFCYNYDPQAKKYVFYAMNIMKIAGIVTVVFLGIMLIRLRKNEREKPSEV